MKNIIISVLLATFLVTGLILTMPLVSDSSESVFNSKENTTYVVKFNVIGCDNCTGLQYCIDGGNAYTVNTCSFAVDLTAGQHTICVLCNYNKRGVLNFTVWGNPIAQIESVYVQNDNGSGCDCASSK
jgi:hypothetical protein